MLAGEGNGKTGFPPGAEFPWFWEDTKPTDFTEYSELDGTHKDRVQLLSERPIQGGIRALGAPGTLL